MKRLLALALATPCTAVWAREPGAHVHGAATLQVAIDGNTLELGLESPLDHLIGFERGPRTDTERQTVRAMAQRFHDPASLFVPTPAARCTPRPSTLASAVIDAALLAAPGAPAARPATPAKAEPDGHADLDATVRFQCDNMAALRGVEVRLFRAFPGLRQIDAVVVTAKGQRGLRLTPDKPLLAW
jgi:hypothetical protein